MEGRNQFTFYRSFYNAVKKIPQEDQLEFLLILIRYGLDHVKPRRIKKTLESDFELVKPNLDSAWRKAMAGAEGGRISKRGPAENKQTLEKISKGKEKNKIKKKIKKEYKTETKGFAAFWARYPVHIGKAAAEAAWVSVCEQYGEACVLSGLENWCTSKAWALENGRYIPKADKWLKETWFLQEPAQELPKGACGQLGQAELEAIQRLLKED